MNASVTCHCSGTVQRNSGRLTPWRQELVEVLEHLVRRHDAANSLIGSF